MVKCAVDGCQNYQGRHDNDQNLKFFCFPKNPELRNKWAAACVGGSEINFNLSRICSEHFTEQDWSLDHLLLNVFHDQKRLRPGAVPSQKLPKIVEPQSKEQRELVKGTEAGGTPSDIFQAEIDPPLAEENELSLGGTNKKRPPTSLQELRQENISLRQEARKLLVQIRKAESIVFKMEKIFTKSQIKRLKYPQKHCNWKYEDVASSISLFSASPAMYQMLWRKKYPLPSPSTIRKWAATLKLRPGIIGSALKTLTSRNHSDQDRLCILAFYEVRLKRPHLSDDQGEVGLRPYKYAQMFILRGLVTEWKQIVYYNFDCMMPSLVLKDLIRTLRDINYIVVAVVSGMGSRKQAMWRDLRVDTDQPSFQVFYDEEVFCFANVPHIIKRLRNHFLQSGFLINDAVINVEPLNELLTVESSDLWVSHDLTHAHVNRNKIGRHNLQAALQLFSESVAETIRKCVTLGKMSSPYAIECSDFIQLVDQWFGVFSSKPITLNSETNYPAYGLELEEQNYTLATMSDVIRNLKPSPDEEELEAFQKGILLNNHALPRMLEYLKRKHHVQQVMTNNLNADDIEHSFGIRKSNAGVAFQPTAQEFKNRLRAGILANLNIDV